MDKIKKKREVKDNSLEISKGSSCTGKDEVYCHWYMCPKCVTDYIRYHDNFCSQCGIKLKWVE